MPQIREILCPIDFSDTARHAIEHAVMLARWYGARITGLHVYTPIFIPVPGIALAPGPTGAVLDDEEMARLNAEMTECLRPAIDARIETDALIQEGMPAADILECAMAIPADLIVMGTHGTTGFEHLVLGSVTERVLRKAACPVLTVPPRAQAAHALPFKRILCPIDFSESSIAALQFAFSLAQEADAQLTILHVLEWPVEEEPLANRSFNVPEYHVFREEEARKKLDALIPEDVKNWCEPSARLTHGKAYREIVGLATEEAADLIVMGVHGRLPLDLVFGSTVNQVVRRATCPVLTVRH